MPKIGKNALYLRKANEKSILSIIRDNTVSRSDIARMTGLTKPAVAAIVDSLILREFVEEIEATLLNSRGRHPTMLRLRTNAYFALGVGIFRDRCHIGVTDLTGGSLESRDILIDKMDSAEAVRHIAKELQRLIADLRIPEDRILGIGVSVPGPVDTTTGEILNPPNFQRWHGVNVVRMMRRHFSHPIYIENDATAYALDENLFGFGRRFRNYVELVLIDGVGSAAILCGEPFRGEHGLNPEVGHVGIDYNGPVCTCGNRGCLELYTSIPLVVQKAVADGIPVHSWNDVVDRAVDGDPRCLDILRKEAFFLCVAIENIVNIFAPEAVILSGKLQYRSETLMRMIGEDIDRRFASKRNLQPQVLISGLKQDSETLAATSIVINHFFYLNGENIPCG